MQVRTSQECAICLDDKHDDMGYQQCGHSFGVSCISSWLVLSSTCPTCKTRAYTLSIYDKNGILQSEEQVIEKNTQITEDIQNERQLAQESLDQEFYLDQFSQQKLELANLIEANSSKCKKMRWKSNKYEYILEDLLYNVTKIIKDIKKRSSLLDAATVYERFEHYVSDISKARYEIYGTSKANTHSYNGGWGVYGQDLNEEDDYYYGYDEEGYYEENGYYDEFGDYFEKKQSDDNIVIYESQKNTQDLQKISITKGKPKGNKKNKKKSKKNEIQDKRPKLETICEKKIEEQFKDLTISEKKDYSEIEESKTFQNVDESLIEQT